ncbi:MAG: phage tail protein [Firmicutes bacterium]|nr:phage tail protein [Bacillota bacterium]
MTQDHKPQVEPTQGKLARFDATGRPLAFFDPALDYPGEDLSDTVQITDEQWLEFLNNPGARRWDGHQVVPCDPPTQPLTWEDVRARRDALLRESDWTQLPDAPMDASLRAAWAQYRQALRDLPQVFLDPADVVWPAPPTEPAQ